MRKRIEQIKALIKSPQGRNTMVFMVFLVISAVLWVVQSLNEDVQTDLKFRIDISNIPDSVTRISPMPDAVNVSVRSRGTHLLKYAFAGKPDMDIDYRRYKKGNRIQMNETQMRAYFRDVIGAGTQIQSVAPDSLLIYFTDKPGVKMPVKANIQENFGPQMGVLKRMAVLTDSACIYSADGKVGNMRYVSTSPIVVNTVSESQTLKVALQVPPGYRAVPDSVEVHFEVEPMVSKSAMVDIVPVHVPPHTRIIPVPAQAEVFYMVPMSVYSSIRPVFRVEADYNSINRENPSKIAVELTDVPDSYTNVFLAVDSVEYILEQ